MTKYILAACAAIALAAGSARAADEIIVTVRDGSVDFGVETLFGTFDSSEAITLDTDDLVTAAGGDLVFVRIYDASSFNGGTPAHTVGPVSINVVGGVRPREVRVLVAPPPNSLGQNGYDDYLFNPLQLMSFAGARAFTSLTINEPAPGIDEWLVRNRVRLALSTSGGDVGRANQNDRIDAGQIYRLQAETLVLPNGQLQGGTIHAALNAFQNQGNFESFLFFGAAPMAYVSAGNAIRGNITSWHDGDDAFQVADIGRIIVGPSLNAAGIHGDIESKRAGIDSIFTTGPIGTPTTPVKVWAADGIDFIRARVEGGNGVALDRDFHASVRSNLDWQPAIGPDGGPTPRVDGQIHLIETGGDLVGEVIAANLAWFDGSSTQQAGILVRGNITAPITIDLNLENADIIARNIYAPIRIGVKAKGAIVATDNDGWIESVQIGENSNADPEVLEAYRNSFPSAFVGNDCPPVNDVDPATGLRIAAPWFDVGGCIDLGSRDSVIRADAIGDVQLRGMTRIYRVIGRFDLKDYSPRVEARMFGALSVSDLREGIVWSGKLEFDASGAVANDPKNDFATTGSSPRFTCIGPGSDVWITDFGDALVSETLFGEIHVDRVTNTEKVLIGRDIGGTDLLTGLRVGACPCDREVIPATIECGYYAGVLLQEDSPRSTLLASQGAVRLGRLGPNNVLRGELSALVGQVIVNAANGAGSLEGKWYGDVAVRTSASTLTTLSINELQPSRAPYYSEVSSTLGLGSVGVVPFNLHGTDCLPPNGTEGICDVEPYPPNNNKRTVVLRHYGPVSEVAGSLPSLVIERQDWCLDCSTTPCQDVQCWTDVSSCFNISVAPTSGVSPSNITGEREIWVWPKTTTASPCLGETWASKKYRIRPRLSMFNNVITTRIRSDETFAVNDPPVVYWTYTVDLQCFDMNMSGMPDTDDVAVFAQTPADFDKDEAITPTDLSLLVEAIINGGE